MLFLHDTGRQDKNNTNTETNKPCWANSLLGVSPGSRCSPEKTPETMVASCAGVILLWCTGHGTSLSNLAGAVDLHHALLVQGATGPRVPGREVVALVGTAQLGVGLDRPQLELVPADLVVRRPLVRDEAAVGVHDADVAGAPVVEVGAPDGEDGHVEQTLGQDAAEDLLAGAAQAHRRVEGAARRDGRRERVAQLGLAGARRLEHVVHAEVVADRAQQVVVPLVQPGRVLLEALRAQHVARPFLHEALRRPFGFVPQRHDVAVRGPFARLGGRGAAAVRRRLARVLELPFAVDVLAVVPAVRGEPLVADRVIARAPARSLAVERLGPEVDLVMCQNNGLSNSISPGEGRGQFGKGLPSHLQLAVGHTA